MLYRTMPYSTLYTILYYTMLYSTISYYNAAHTLYGNSHLKDFMVTVMRKGIDRKKGREIPIHVYVYNMLYIIYIYIDMI